MTLIGSLIELFGGGRSRLQDLAEKVELSADEQAWLERRFASHPEDRAVFRESRRWLELAKRMEGASPHPGLADRALARARRAEEQDVQARVVGRPRWTWSVVTGAVAVSVFVYAIAVQFPDRGASSPSTAGLSRALTPDLVISTSAGPAEARSRFEAVVERFDGRVEVRDGGLVAELPSEALLEVMQSLRAIGALEVENEVGDLEDRRRVVVRLSLR